MSKTNDEKNITFVQNLAHVFPLPVRAVSEPWEDLASLLSRTAEQMGYKKVHWLLRPEDSAYSRLDPDVCFLLQDATYQYLGHLLQLSEEELYKLTLHRFLLQMLAPEEVQPAPSGYLERPLFPRRSHFIHKLFLPKSATRVCPKCLAEEPACGVLYWNIGPLVSCLKHHIFLVDCCPHCQGRIPRLRSVLTHCPRCRSGDYRLAPSVSLPDEPLFLSSQAIILAQLGLEEEYMRGIPSVDGRSPLHELLPWQYFQLLESFQNVLGPFFPNHPLLQTVAGPPIPSRHRVSPRFHSSLGEWASFVITFHTLFVSWPDNFTTLLESLPSVHSGTSDSAKRIKQFGKLYDAYLYKRLRDPAFAFLREAFEDYLKKRYMGGRVSNLRPFIGMDSMQIATECTYLTLDQAMQLLGIKSHNLYALINRGAIRTHRNLMGTKGKISLWLIEKEDVEALLAEWKGLLPLETIAQKLLGVSKRQVLALTRADLLLPARGPSIDRCHTWYYKSEDIERLKSALLQYACKIVPSDSKCIPLSTCGRSLGLPLVESLKEILSGHLVIIDTEREIPLFQRLVVSKSEVKRFLGERLKAERSDLNLLSARDVMKSLGVGEATLKEWMRLGLLVGKRQMVKGMIHGILFQKEMVDSFRHTYVFTKEAAALLDVTSSTIHYYVSRGMLHPVGLPKPKLFLREELESLILPHTLTMRQAAVLLDMSASKLYNLVKAGHIPRVQFAQWPEKKWLLNSDVERFRDKIEK
jgi:predicted DNA-binding transcriptional regulator AlpA